MRYGLISLVSQGSSKPITIVLFVPPVGLAFSRWYRSRLSRCISLLAWEQRKASSTSTAPPSSLPPSLVPQIVTFHCQSESVKHEPSRLLSDPHCAVNLPRANAILAVSQHPHGREPLLQGYWRILENRCLSLTENYRRQSRHLNRF